METAKTPITVTAILNAPVEFAWECFTGPEHITGWNFAADTWHCPAAENDLRPGGKFSYRMEAKDGSFGFDFWGNFIAVEQNSRLEMTLGDGRKMSVVFTANGNTTEVSETFEPEETNPIELQRGGWQLILNNYKLYTDSAYATRN